MPALRRPAGLIALVAVGLVVVVGLLWLLRDDRPAAEPGEQLDPLTSDPIPGYVTEVELPTGQLRVKVSDPVEELPPPCCIEGEQADVRAPRGGSFVGVEILPAQAVGGLVIPGTQSVPGEGPTPVYELVVTDDRTAPATAEVEAEAVLLDRLDEQDQVWVALGSRPEIRDLELRVAFDGVTQVVAPQAERVDHGDAEQLYATRPEVERTGCGRLRPSDGLREDGPTYCEVAAQSIAYLPEVGWAGGAEDRWYVVSVAGPSSVRLQRSGPGRPVDYFGTVGDLPQDSPRVRLGGEPPDEVLAEGSEGPVVVAWRVGAGGLAPDARLVITSVVEVESYDDGVDGAEEAGPIEARLRWTRRPTGVV